MILLLLACVVFCTWAFLRNHYDWLAAPLESLVVCSALAMLWIEAVSLWSGINSKSAVLLWTSVAVTALVFGYKQTSTLVLPKLGLMEILTIGCVLWIACFVGATAWLSPPNSGDAMAYHLPRVIYWLQQGSVDFFPTSYYPQVMLQPVAEYLMLHTFLLSGGDRWVNFVAFAGFFGSVLGVAAVARAMGLGRAMQCAAALFCVSLPAGILQASGAKNDTLLGLWLVSAIFFLLRWLASGKRVDILLLGLSSGLAIGTKGTAFLFLPCLLASTWLAAGRRRQAWMPLLAIAGGTLLLNLPQYARNQQLSGSPIGFDSAHGDGVYRWRNEHLGWKPTFSNLVRNLSEQMGARSDAWNKSVYALALKMHHALGVDINDPGTTWHWTRFEPPVNANHEANANSRWHLLLSALAGAWAAVASVRSTDGRRWLVFGLGPLASFVLFCAYLKWQPTQARMELPLFVASSPLAGWFLGSFWAGRPIWMKLIPVAVLVVFVSNTRLALVQNWTRPLQDSGNLLSLGREHHYFNDLGLWNSRADYLPAVDRISQSGCLQVGIDIDENPLEYPVQALLRSRSAKVRFRHVRAKDEAGLGDVCAIFCPNCPDGGEREKKYLQVGAPIRFGQVLVFVKD